MQYTPQDLKQVMSQGLLSFPLTDFDAQGDFNPKGYAERLEWLAPYGATALFAAGGTGEFFSLTAEEYPAIIQTAVDTCRGKVPIIAGAGGPTRFAIQCAQAAEKAGAHGILLLPHYLTEASQEGLIAHVEQVCKSVKFGVIVYNRNVCKLTPDSLAILADRCPYLAARGCRLSGHPQQGCGGDCHRGRQSRGALRERASEDHGHRWHSETHRQRQGPAANWRRQ
jgi:5-dehydro-4-deoxyglucarate dehydratase